jgi:hypothetical protein
VIAIQHGGHGRPLWFLAAVGTGWVAARALLLWSVGADPATPLPLSIVPALGRVIAARPILADALRTGAPAVGAATLLIPLPPRVRRSRARAAGDGPFTTPTPVATPVPPHGAAPAAAPDRSPPPVPAAGVPPFVASPALARQASARAPRWSGSAWAVARAGRAAPGNGTGGSYGGSQAGLRIVRTLDRRGRVAVTGRLTTPLGAGLREASVGLEWQPTRLPVRLVAENRFVLGAGTGGPGVALVGGFGPVAVLHRLYAEGYGQAGMLHRTQLEPYADAAVRLTHRLARIGPTRIDLGAGTWGGAQRGAARLDIGPTLAVAVPVASKTVRLALDWRERVAGRARPGSGPALTVGTDF